MQVDAPYTLSSKPMDCRIRSRDFDPPLSQVSRPLAHLIRNVQLFARTVWVSVLFWMHVEKGG